MDGIDDLTEKNPPVPDPTSFQFFAPGKPETQGSKKQMLSRSTGRIITMDDSETLHSWRGLVAYECQRAMRAAGMSMAEKGTPIRVNATFTLLRPAGHFGTGRNAKNLKPSAPKYPTGAPDKDKLTRAIGDAMRGVAYHDDSQVVQGSTAKQYGEKQGAWITVSRL